MNFTPRRIRIRHAREFDRGSWAILRLNHADEITAQLIAERENQEAAYAIEWLQKAHGVASGELKSHRHSNWVRPHPNSRMGMMASLIILPVTGSPVRKIRCVEKVAYTYEKSRPRHPHPHSCH